MKYVLAFLSIILAAGSVAVNGQKPAKRCVTTIPAPNVVGSEPRSFFEENHITRTFAGIGSDLARGYNTAGRIIAETPGDGNEYQEDR